MVTQNTISWTMLENGINSLKTAANNLKLLQDNYGNKNYHKSLNEIRDLIKSVILNLSTGVELVIKHSLFLKHWSFIFADIDKADRKKLESGDFVSVEMKTAIDRLDKLCNVQIPKYKTLYDLKNKRNKLEHYKISFVFEEIYVLTINVLSIIMDFINNNIFDLSNDEESELEELKELLLGLEQYLILREQYLKEKYPEEKFFYCPRCGKESANNVKDKVTCQICYYINNPDDSASDYIENIMNISSYECAKEGCEFPQYYCPHCDSKSFVFDNSINNAAFCYSCGEDRDLSDYSFCEECGSIYESSCDEIDICTDCIKYKIDNDD